MTTQTATYSKLRDGSWGIRVIGSAIPGDRIYVTKKSGEGRYETVAAVLWCGDGVNVCAIERDGPEPDTRGSRDPHTPCPKCGYSPDGDTDFPF